MSAYYEHIDELPIYNWFKIHETKELKYLCKTEKKLKTSELNTLPKLWETICNQYIQSFGFGSNQLKVWKKEKQIALLCIERCETEDETIGTFIDIAEAELERMQKKNKNIDTNIYEIKSQMEKGLGFTINMKQCTVIEFYSYQKTLEKNAK